MTRARPPRNGDRPAKPGEAGLTLIEVVIAMAVLMLAFTAIYRALRTASSSAAAVSEMAQQQSDSRREVDELVSDLRMAWSGNDTLARFVNNFGPCNVTFYSPTRETAPRQRQITYSITTGTDLKRTDLYSTNTATAGSTAWVWAAASTTITVLKGIDNIPNNAALGCDAAHPLFRYYAKDDTEIVPPAAASVSSIKRVAISLTIDRIVGKFPEPDVFATSVEMRSK